VKEGRFQFLEISAFRVRIKAPAYSVVEIIFGCSIFWMLIAFRLIDLSLHDLKVSVDVFVNHDLQNALIPSVLC